MFLSKMYSVTHYIVGRDCLYSLVCITPLLWSPSFHSNSLFIYFDINQKPLPGSHRESSVRPSHLRTLIEEFTLNRPKIFFVFAFLKDQTYTKIVMRFQTHHWYVTMVTAYTTLNGKTRLSGKLYKTCIKTTNYLVINLIWFYSILLLCKYYFRLNSSSTWQSCNHSNWLWDHSNHQNASTAIENLP